MKSTGALMKILLASLACACVIALPVGTASADAAPPTPCTGEVAKDPAKDETIAPTPLIADPQRRTGEDPNLDIRSLFFTYRTVDGKPKLTAHIAVTNLTKNIPAERGPSATASWLVEFDLVNTVSYLRATTDGETVTYEYGKNGPVGPGVPLNATNPADTTGTFTEGPDGVVSIDWPADVPIAPGTKIEGLYSVTYVSNVLEQVTGGYFTVDSAPDEGGKVYTVTACPAAQPAGSGAAAPPPASDQGSAAPPAGGGTGQPAPAPGQAPAPAPGTLPATGMLAAEVAADKGKRKTARKRGLRVRVRCSVQCRAKAVVSVDRRTARKLRLGKKALVIGTGQASITKAGRVPFYVKLSRKAKKALGRKGVKKLALTVVFTVTDAQGKQLKKATKKSTLR